MEISRIQIRYPGDYIGKENLNTNYFRSNYFCIYISFLSCKLDTLDNASYVYWRKNALFTF